MSEKMHVGESQGKVPDKTPLDAQEQLYAAIEFGVNTGAPGIKAQRNGISKRIQLADIIKPNFSISFIDLNPDHDELEEGEPLAINHRTNTMVQTAQGRYHASADIDTVLEEGNVSHGSVVRKDYSHSFKPNHELRATTLINSLAAKRLGSHVLAHTDNVAQAREEYLSIIDPNNIT